MKLIVHRGRCQLAKLCKTQPRLAKFISFRRLGVASDNTKVYLNGSQTPKNPVSKTLLENTTGQYIDGDGLPPSKSHDRLDDHLHDLFTSTAAQNSIAAALPSSSLDGVLNHRSSDKCSHNSADYAASTDTKRPSKCFQSDHAGEHLPSDLTSIVPDQTWIDLRGLLRQPDTVTSEDLWRSCKHAISKSSQTPEARQGILRPQQLETLHDVLKTVCWADALRDHEFIIAPSAVIRHYEEYGFRSHWHSASIWTLLARALQAKHSLKDRQNDQVSTLLEIRRIMSEILKIWGLYWPGRQSSNPVGSSTNDQRDMIHIPSEMFASDVLPYSPRKLASRFQYCLDRIRGEIPIHDEPDALRLHRPREEMRSLAAAAAMTRDCFVPGRGIASLHDMPEGRHYQRFLAFLNAIIVEVHSGYEVAYHQLSNAGLTTTIIERALHSWRSPTESHSARPIQKNTENKISRRPLLRHLKGFGEAVRSSRERIIALTGALDDAVKGSNAELADSIWKEVQRTSSECDLDQEDGHNMEKLYIALLSAFFALRRAETATEVWNYLVQKGHMPTKVHWTAMLHGCIKAHDPASLQEIWARMLQSNVVPDTATWTTYIRGLIKCRRWKEGVNALDQLGRSWSQRANPKPSSRHKSSRSVLKEAETDSLAPSIAPVNAALDALIDIGKSDLLQPLLAWASTHQVHPDTHTYNILLRPLVHNGNNLAIASHLATMSAAGCPPDIATFTIIISSLVSSDDFICQSPQDQERVILKFLEDMHSAGVPPNTYTYSTLLTTILNPPSSHRKRQPTLRTKVAAEPSSRSPANFSVVHTILAHMHANSIPPTPHIYTILLGHYFSQQPPRLEDVRSLWQSICALPSGSKDLADPIFYDRMIEGLAAAGAAEEALNFLQTAVADGKMLSWVVLGRVLESLEQSKDHANLSWLVREVEREGGLMKWGQREVRGRDSFFRKVEVLRAGGFLPGTNENIESKAHGISHVGRR